MSKEYNSSILDIGVAIRIGVFRNSRSDSEKRPLRGSESRKLGQC